MAPTADGTSISTQEFFRENGYALLPQVISPQLRQSTYVALVRLLGKYNVDLSPSLLSELLQADPWVDDRFHDAMISFRQKQPLFFGAMYDTIQTSIALQQLCGCDALIEAACQAIGEDPHCLTLTGHMMRMDAPEDTRNVLAWHQDVSYYNQNEDGANGFVLWIPMHKVWPGNGTLQILPGSHLGGRVQPQAAARDALVSEQFRVPEEYVKRYEAVDVLADGGDALIFNFNFIHRSGRNTSNHMRFVAGIRFHRALADDFLCGQFIYKANERVGRMSKYKTTASGNVTAMRDGSTQPAS